MSRSTRWLLVPLAILGLVSAACGSSASKTAATTTATVPAIKGDITVFAASSLTAAFNEVGTAFTAANPDAKATFSYDASSALVAQIIQGAPADLFASADTANMDKLTTPSLNGTAPVVFATNLLQIIVAPGNPKGITGVAALAKADLKVVLCAPEVPCGKYAKQILDTAKVTVTPASLEQNVKGVVTKVTAGEADAGIVYVTDVMAAGAKAAGVDIPADINVIAKYPIASVKASTHADVDQAFIDFLTGSDGQAILAKYGFGKP
jgi:molybdate transport system substrate-binding protein